MSYTPISGTLPQYSNANNELAVDYYLKFYAANTTTPINMSTDVAGTTLLAKCKLNSSGFPISNPLDNDTVFMPHVAQDYRLVIYTNEADADANNTAAAFVNIPYSPVLAYSAITGSAESSANAAAISEANANADAIATAADRVQTGLDVIATAAATNADAIATAADRVQTGLDATATAADRVQTGLDATATSADAVATAADRVQTGLDVISASSAASVAASNAVALINTLTYLNDFGLITEAVGVTTDYGSIV